MRLVVDQQKTVAQCFAVQAGFLGGWCAGKERRVGHQWAMGKVTVTRVPRSGALSIAIAPPCAVTISRLTVSPRPVPLPTGREVKKGSKTRPRISAGMPQPLSAT